MWVTWFKRTETIYNHPETIYSNRIFLFYSLHQQGLTISENSCPEDESWKLKVPASFPKKWCKWTFNYSTFQKKTSTDNLLSKILWILAASLAVAIDLKLLFCDLYPILTKPFLERVSETDSRTLQTSWLCLLLSKTLLRFCLTEKRMNSDLTTGCPGAIWGKGSIRQSHLSSPPPHKFWNPSRIHSKGIWVRGALFK